MTSNILSDAPDTLLKKAVSLHQAGRLEEAESLYNQLIAAYPEQVDAFSLLGTIYCQRGRYEEGISLLERAIALNPNYAEAYFNRALSLQRLGHYEEALKDYHTATVIDPNYTEAFWHKSLILLTLGQYEEGWKLYEWRWKRTDHNIRVFSKPLWLGKNSLIGKTILLHAEQGLGDAIQFCRYVPMVETLGANVILEVPPSLMTLLSTLNGSFQLVGKGESLPDYDFHCPLSSLPLAFQTRLDTIPAAVPYLFADPGKQKVWQERLGKKERKRVGLVWSGSPTNANDYNRSIPLKLFEPLLACDCDFHSLQKEIKPSDKITLREKNAIFSHVEYLNDFSDTAALVSEMDIVISVDTSIAHLVGAMGKPVWILLPFVPDFRWMLDREDSPWYPTARLFRQPKRENWEKVITELLMKLNSSY